MPPIDPLQQAIDTLNEGKTKRLQAFLDPQSLKVFAEPGRITNDEKFWNLVKNLVTQAEFSMDMFGEPEILPIKGLSEEDGGEAQVLEARGCIEKLKGCLLEEEKTPGPLTQESFNTFVANTYKTHRLANSDYIKSFAPIAKAIIEQLASHGIIPTPVEENLSEKLSFDIITYLNWLIGHYALNKNDLDSSSNKSTYHKALITIATHYFLEQLRPELSTSQTDGENHRQLKQSKPEGGNLKKIKERLDVLRANNPQQLASEKEIGDLKEQIAALQKQLITLSAKYVNNQQSSQNLQAQLAVYENEIEQLQKKLTEAKEKGDNCRINTLAHQRGRSDALVEKKASLAKQNSQLKQQIEQEKQKNQKLEQQNQELILLSFYQTFFCFMVDFAVANMARFVLEGFSRKQANLYEIKHTINTHQGSKLDSSTLGNWASRIGEIAATRRGFIFTAEKTKTATALAPTLNLFKAEEAFTSLQPSLELCRQMLLMIILLAIKSMSPFMLLQSSEKKAALLAAKNQLAKHETTVLTKEDLLRVSRQLEKAANMDRKAYKKRGDNFKAINEAYKASLKKKLSQKLPSPQKKQHWATSEALDEQKSIKASPVAAAQQSVHQTPRNTAALKLKHPQPKTKSGRAIAPHLGTFFSQINSLPPDNCSTEAGVMAQALPSHKPVS